MNSLFQHALNKSVGNHAQAGLQLIRSCMSTCKNKLCVFTCVHLSYRPSYTERKLARLKFVRSSVDTSITKNRSVHGSNLGTVPNSSSTSSCKRKARLHDGKLWNGFNKNCGTVPTKSRTVPVLNFFRVNDTVPIFFLSVRGTIGAYGPKLKRIWNVFRIVEYIWNRLQQAL